MGIENLDVFLGRGGISSMSWMLFFVLMVIVLGGILYGVGFLVVLLVGIIDKVKWIVSLIVVIIVFGFLGNVVMGEVYILIILNC